MSNTLQQSTLLYTEREIKGSYWAALLCSLHATSHTLNVFSEAFTEKEAKGSFCGSSMSHILLSNSFYTERETKGSYCGRNCIFWSASHQLGALQSEILSLMSWSRTRDKAFFFSSTLRGHGTCDIQTRKYLSEYWTIQRKIAPLLHFSQNLNLRHKVISCDFCPHFRLSLLSQLCCVCDNVKKYGWFNFAK